MKSNKERVLEALEHSKTKATEVGAEGIAILLVSPDGGSYFAEYNLDVDCVEAFHAFAPPSQLQ